MTTDGDEEDECPAQGTPSDLATLLFSSTPTSSALGDIHPPPTHVFLLWQVFLQNVNPLSKVVHAPSVQNVVITATRGVDGLARPVLALLFAIYSAAIMSMQEGECLESMGETRAVLLARYVAATQAALSGAGFMKSMSLTLLQAFTIHLVYGPYSTQSGSRLKCV